MHEVQLKNEYITLGQLLKIANIISSGGQAKFFLEENDVYVNGVLDTRRGKKLRVGDEVEISNFGTYVMKAQG